jgi:hypothetical protein
LLPLFSAVFDCYHGTLIELKGYYHLSLRRIQKEAWINEILIFSIVEWPNSNETIAEISEFNRSEPFF